MNLLLFYIYTYILNISSLTTYDYICIVANYILSTNDRATESVNDRGYSKEILELLEKKFKATASTERMLNIQFTTDLEQFRLDNYDYLVELYDAFDNGILPCNGAYNDQSNQIIEIIQTIRSCQFEWENKQRQAQQKEMKK